MLYAREVLGVELWGPIAEALSNLLTPPYAVSIDSGHGVGKTFGAAVAVNWWYDTRDPCWVISTAPNDRDVKDLLWTEIRLQRQRAKVPLPNDLLPAAAEMRSGPEHVAKGYTARDANSAHGRHRPNMLFVFDEKEGVPPMFWDGVASMFRPGSGDAVLVIGNPLTTTSRAYFEHKATDLHGNPKWHRVKLSCLEHPNVTGKGTQITGALTPAQLEKMIADYGCDPVDPGDERETDFAWQGKVYRPGPVAEPRILGRRPSAGTYGVWSEAVWERCMREPPEVPRGTLPVIGCDVAQFGDDYTVMHTRCGSVSLRHFSVNGWDDLKIAARLKIEAEWCAAWATGRRDPEAAPVRPEQIAIHVEDDSTGRAVQGHLGRWGLSFVPLNASSNPQRDDLYPNLRSELWFMCRQRAAHGLVNFSRLNPLDLRRIETQFLAPEWEPDNAGRRQVEEKKKTKEKLGRSPDDADAVNLAYYEAGCDLPTIIRRER